MRRESYPTPGPVALEIRVPAGRIELETGDRPDTEVELEQLRNNDASAAAVESARVEMRERPSGGQLVTIDVDDERRFAFLGRGAEVLVRVRCPSGTNVEAEGGSTDVEGQGRYGSVKVSTASGDVEFARIERDATVNTASGDVELGSVDGGCRVNAASGDVSVREVGADAEVNSASGDVQLQAVRGALRIHSASGDVSVGEAGSSVTVKTASGDLELESVARGEANLQSASGDINVGVKRGTRLWLDVRSRSGETSSDLEADDAPAGGDEGPSLELRATSMSGDIHIGRA